MINHLRRDVKTNSSQVQFLVSVNTGNYEKYSGALAEIVSDQITVRVAASLPWLPLTSVSQVGILPLSRTPSPPEINRIVGEIFVINLMFVIDEHDI